MGENWARLGGGRLLWISNMCAKTQRKSRRSQVRKNDPGKGIASGSKEENAMFGA